MSAQQFEQIGDTLAAYRTLDEMLDDGRIRDLPLASQAAEKREEIRARLPESALDTPAAPEPNPAEPNKASKT
jgi:hypothetical protein